MKKIASFLVMVAVVCVSAPAFGSNYGCEDMAVVTDVLLVRPLGLAAVVIGTAVFIVALPFSIPSGSVGPTARVLIVEPFNHTFLRPIGYPECKAGPAVSREP